MPNDATLSVFPESLKRKHEVSERRVRNVLIVGGGAAFLVILGMFVSGLLIHFLSRAHPMQQMTPLGIIIAPDIKPLEQFPKPNLQIDDDHMQRTALQQEQNQELHSYGWVDRSKGIVRIPIDRAMDLILQRGLPMQTNDISQTDGSPLQLIQKIPEKR